MSDCMLLGGTVAGARLDGILAVGRLVKGKLYKRPSYFPYVTPYEWSCGDGPKDASNGCWS